MIDMIKVDALELLAKSGAIESVHIFRSDGGYGLLVTVGKNKMRLRSQRSDTKIFKSLDTLAKYLESIGFTKCDLDLGDYGDAELD